MATEKITKVNVNGQVYDLGGSGTGEVTNITYSELVSLMESGGLIAGAKYRITDYVTSFSSWKSGNHQFDVIVTACANNALYTEAQAALHEGDDYFANSDLNSWKLWYDITNNTNKHKQANSSGKGTILRMIDEFNNDADYDFKNAMFEVTNTTFEALPNTLYFYTFSLYAKSVKQLTQEDISDMSINSSCVVRNNIIEGLSHISCKFCCIGAKKGLTNLINPHIRNNKIILQQKAVSNGVIVLSDGIINDVINNCIDEFVANNPVNMRDSILCGNIKIKIPYQTNGLGIFGTKITGDLNLEIQGGSCGLIDNSDLKISGKYNIIFPTLNDFTSTLLIASSTISGTSTITITEQQLISRLVVAKDDVCAAFDLLAS